MKLAIFFSFLFLISAVSAEQLCFDQTPENLHDNNYLCGKEMYYSYISALDDTGISYPEIHEYVSQTPSDFDHEIIVNSIHNMAVACNQKNMSFKYGPNNSSCEPKVYPTTRPLSVFLQEPEPQCEIYSAGYAPRGVPTELEQVNADIVRNLTCAKLVSDHNDRMLVQAHAAMECLPPNTFVRYYNETETSCFLPD